MDVITCDREVFPTPAFEAMHANEVASPAAAMEKDCGASSESHRAPHEADTEQEPVARASAPRIPRKRHRGKRRRSEIRGPAGRGWVCAKIRIPKLPTSCTWMWTRFSRRSSRC